MGTTDSGLDLETKIFSTSGRGKTFFLTSLFIELQDQVRLPSFKTRLASSPAKDETHRKGKQARAKPVERNRWALQTVGWISRLKSSRPPVEGKLFS